MPFTNWVDFSMSEIEDSLPYGRYFDSIGLEKFVDEYSLFNSQLGIDLILRENLSIKAIYFYSGKSSAAEQFKGELPFNLNFSNSREFIKTVLGEFQFTGGGDSSVLYGKTPFWDRYAFDSYSLPLQFAEDFNRIDLITLYSNIEII